MRSQISLFKERISELDHLHELGYEQINQRIEVAFSYVFISIWN